MKNFAVIIYKKGSEKGVTPAKLYIKTKQDIYRRELEEILTKLVKPGYSVKILWTRDSDEHEWYNAEELIMVIGDIRLYKTVKTLEQVGYNETNCGNLMIMPSGIIPIDGWYSEPNLFIRLKPASEYLTINMKAVADNLNKQDLGLHFKVWNGPTGSGIYATIGYDKRGEVEVYQDMVNLTWKSYSPKYEWVEKKVEL